MRATTGLFALGLTLLAVTTLGCSTRTSSGGSKASSEPPVDLDVVLAAFDRAVAKADKNAAPKPAPVAAPTPTPAAPAAAGAADGGVKAAADTPATADTPKLAAKAPAATPAKAPNANDPAKTAIFLNTFATELNSDKVVATSAGVLMRSDGAIEGYEDKNRNKLRDPGERQLFEIEVDEENKRIVASTHTESGETYRRPRSMGMGGFFMGYMVARMMGGQRGFYRGRSRPRFGRMNNRGYHRSSSRRPVSSRRGSSSSRRSTGSSSRRSTGSSSRRGYTPSRGARSRGGSRGFRSGK